MGLFKEKCPNCGAENSKGSKFCHKCGTQLGSNEKNSCPSCGAPVSNGAKFCPKCGAKLSDVSVVERSSDISKEIGKDGVWKRRPDDFAQRIEVEDIRGVFRKEITVFQGTKALLIQGGVYKGTLDAGVYDLKYAQKWFFPNLETRATVILVDGGELTLKFTIPSLNTKDSFTVDATGQVIAKISDPLLFLENFLKSEYHVSIPDIENRIGGELTFIAQSIISQFNSTDLYGNREVATKLENEFKETLNVGFGRKGLQIISLSNVGFTEGAELFEIAEDKRQASVDISKAKIQYQKASVERNLSTADELDQISADNTITKANQENDHQYADRELDFSIASNKKIFDAKQEQERKEFLQDVAEIEALRNIQKKKKEDDLELKKKDLEIERENERLILENRSNASIESLISVLGGDNPAAKEIAKLELEKRAASLSPEQILAIQSVDSPVAAEALKAKYSADEQKEFNLRTEQIYKENADRMQSIMEASLKAMGSTATAKATEQKATVVAGNGQTVFVNHESVKRCPSCNTKLSDEDEFCPECGAHLK